MALMPGQCKIKKVELTGSHYKCPHVPCSVLLPMRKDFDHLVKGVSDHLVKVHHRKGTNQDNCSFFIRCETREKTISKEELEKWLMFKEPRPPIADFLKQIKEDRMDFQKSLCKALRGIPKKEAGNLESSIRGFTTPMRNRMAMFGRSEEGTIVYLDLEQDPEILLN